MIGALFDGGRLAAEAYLAALAPELFANPIVHWLEDEGLMYLESILRVAGEKFADGIVIDIETNGELSSVLVATTALAIAQASKDQTAIDQAIKETGDAYRKAFHFDGFGNPS